MTSKTPLVGDPTTGIPREMAAGETIPAAFLDASSGLPTRIPAATRYVIAADTQVEGIVPVVLEAADSLLDVVGIFAEQFPRFS